LSDSNYGFLDRLLHRIALQFDFIAESSFDVDQNLVKADAAEIVAGQHVFITGLARAGTTVLLRRFYESGHYRSLTYRDMPFVLAPNLWRRLSSVSRRSIDAAERAHGDNLLVDADSPESFDEVFWRIFAGRDYLKRGCLIPHKPSPEVLDNYVNYVNAILSTQVPRNERYLCKNNNNILRLHAIHEAFPNAMILIPFRDPIQHSFSLLRQHRRFSRLQAESSFTLSYMTWLGHHEFGLDHRPFLFGDAEAQRSSTNELDYWLQLWHRTYSWLEKSKPETAIFVCYEDLCAGDETWDRLAALANIFVDPAIGDRFKVSEQTIDIEIDPRLAETAAELYATLAAQSRRQLG